MSEKSLTTYLQGKKDSGQKLFIPYIVAGASGLERLEEEIEMLAESGATAIELGIPFSDPVADGPVIQQSAMQAFERQVTFAKIIETLQNIHTPVPLILMGYANSFLRFGLDKLVKALEATDVKGLIIPDVPYEYQDFIEPTLEATDIALIQLVTLTSKKERIEQLTKGAQGFIYAVTVNGTTGINQAYRDSLDTHLSFITETSDIPVLAGFGVSKREHVERFNDCCDGVIVGSKIVESLIKKGVPETKKLVQTLTGQ